MPKVPQWRTPGKKVVAIYMPDDLHNRAKRQCLCITKVVNKLLDEYLRKLEHPLLKRDEVQ